MWFSMESEQESYNLSERLIRAISHWQTLTCRDEDIEVLIDQGADVNRIHGTLLPLHCASMVSDCVAVRLLLQKGAKVNEVDGYGRTAIHYAAERDIECVEILLENGADINCCDGNNDTPLHWAAFKNNADCVKLLLQCGATVDPRDFNNDTPLGWATRKGNLNAINILLQYNAQVNIRNSKGDTPLTRALGIQIGGLNTDNDDLALDLLLKAAGQFNIDETYWQLRKKLVEDNKLSEMVLPLCTNVRTLQDLAKFKIRSSLGYRYLPNVVPKLPLPKSLRDLVSLRH